MGLAGSVHCLAMCGGTSAAVVKSCGGSAPAGWSSFYVGRLLGYALAGALAAAGMGVLAQLGELSPALRPLWTMTHMAALALGIYLLWKGHQPAWLDRLGKQGQRQPAGGWVRVHGPLKATGAGLIWFAWPCGLLQSALMVAALANGPVGGAATMAAFAFTSSLGLGIGPVIWHRAGKHTQWLNAKITTLVVRVSGLGLAAASSWALGHGLWVQVAAYCMT